MTCCAWCSEPPARPHARDSREFIDHIRAAQRARRDRIGAQFHRVSLLRKNPCGYTCRASRAWL